MTSVTALKWLNIVKRTSLKSLIRKFRDRSHEIRRQIGIPSIGALRRMPDEMHSLHQEINQLKKELHHLHEGNSPQRVGQQPDSMCWFVDCHVADAEANFREFPPSKELVSIFLLAQHPDENTCRAIESVLNQFHQNWELFIVCSPNSAAFDYLESYTRDSRIQLVAADSVDLKNSANGEVIAWLEDHCTWFPYYLTSLLQQLSENSCEVICSPQIVESLPGGNLQIRGNRSVLSDAEAESVQLPTPSQFAHRRRFINELSETNEKPLFLLLPQLISKIDQGDVQWQSTIGSRQSFSAMTGLSIGGYDSYFRYRAMFEAQRPVANPPKILYAVWNFPQVTETYIRWEIECFRRWGVEIEVWSEFEKVESPYPTDVPVHYGELEDAIKKVKPQMLHFHWLNIAQKHLDTIMKSALPTTVRGHGYEFNTEHAQKLFEHATIKKIFLFPHYAQHFISHPKIESLKSAFSGELYFPEFNKDHRLVVRVGSCKREKDNETFIDVAKACPNHKFVLIVGRLLGLADYVDELIEYNRSQGSPVDIRVNVPTEEVAELVRRAGIYLHTYGTEEPFGMPISIAEAMATGCYVLVRELPGAEEYLGSGGHLYSSAEQAAYLINSTQQWYPGHWEERQRLAIEHAHQEHGDVNVLRPILETWLQELAVSQDVPGNLDAIYSPELQPALNYLMQTAQNFEMESNYGSPYLAHITGTYQRLQKWNVPKYLQMAGFLHSIYAPWAGQLARIAPTNEGRQNVAQLIGQKAADLTYLFGAIERFAFVKTFQNGNSADRFYDRFSKSEIQIDAETVQDLAFLHIAEMMEKRKRLGFPSQNVEGYAQVAKFLGGIVWEDFQRECFPAVQLATPAIPEPHLKFAGNVKQRASEEL